MSPTGLCFLFDHVRELFLELVAQIFLGLLNERGKRFLFELLAFECFYFLHSSSEPSLELVAEPLLDIKSGAYCVTVLLEH